jgi:hypothetical protein
MMLYCTVLYCIVLYCIAYVYKMHAIMAYLYCMHAFIQTYRHTDIPTYRKRTYTRSMYIHIFNVGLQPKTRSSVLPLLFFTTCFRCWICRVLIFCRINIQKSQEDLYGFMDPISKGYIVHTVIIEDIQELSENRSSIWNGFGRAEKSISNRR